MVDARLNLFKSKDCRLGRFVGFDDFGLIFSAVLVISFCGFGRFRTCLQIGFWAAGVSEVLADAGYLEWEREYL